MAKKLDSIRKQLMRENKQFKRLYNKHQDYEQRLEKLSCRLYLNEKERIKEKNLKKQKLLLKDKMEKMLREYQQKLASSTKS
ncbi:hypothetical protein CEE39_09285 [bacterium (candidate division B38) B3_B38]|nr:MAG: hypothetical protein CEE39_09285 [bacterium (candidate division B38) B3_B38]